MPIGLSRSVLTGFAPAVAPAGTIYNVTVASGTNEYGTGNKYYIDGFEGPSPTLNLIEGETYVFRQSDSSNATHSLRFSTTANGTWGGGVTYTDGVTIVGTAGQLGAYTQITVAVGAPTLYYYCVNHSGMGGTARAVVLGWTTTSSIGYNYGLYQNQKLDYVGDDSSSRPVFLFGYISNVDSKPYAILFRRNSDATYTFGTPILIWNDANVARTQALSGLNLSSALVGVSHFTVGSGSYARAYTIAKDTLVLGTPGTLRTVEGSGLSAGFSYISYLGASSWGMGGRSGGVRHTYFTVTGTNINPAVPTATTTLVLGDGVFQQTVAFDYQDDDYFRFVACNGNGGEVAAGHFYAGGFNLEAGTPATLDISALGLSFRDISRLNSTNNAVMLTNNSTTIELAPFSVTWPTGGATGAPTITDGTNITITEGGTNANIFDGIDNSLICVYRNSSGDWKRVVVSATGTTLTQSSAVAIGNPAGFNAHAWGKYVSTGQGNLFIALIDGGTGTTDVEIYSEVIV